MSGEGVLPAWRSMRRAQISAAPFSLIDWAPEHLEKLKADLMADRDAFAREYTGHWPIDAWDAAKLVVEGPEPERSRVIEAIAAMPNLGVQIARAQFRVLAGYGRDVLLVDDPVAIAASLLHPPGPLIGDELKSVMEPEGKPEGPNNRQARRRAAAQRRKAR